MSCSLSFNATVGIRRIKDSRVSSRCSARTVLNVSAGEVKKVAVLGASGYTGSEIVRLLAVHPQLDVVALTAESNAGKKFEDVYPQHQNLNLPVLTKNNEVDYSNVDAIFCCLPHGTTQEIVAGLPEDKKVVDLSADFRLRNVDTYAEWYGGDHRAPGLQKQVAYGLTELNRDAVLKARVIANPGCYPTSVQLPLVPLLQGGMIRSEDIIIDAKSGVASLLQGGMIHSEDIIIDAKSGVSGAGRAGKVQFLYSEIAEGINSYGVGSHRHMPEIEQELSLAAGSDVTISFTPHLMPMARGMQSTIYVKMTEDVSVDDIRAALVTKYADEPFVQVLGAGVVPHTRHVRGSNLCLISVFPDRIKGRAVILSVIDNLVKGASGQALQNMNLIMGLPETMGLMQQPMFP
eukprot:CAMPEP_0114258964 /NCGR_PEP_ID=MMETSP0058-20121206/19625_1 /TAXON_ID=36894 /ORGANISM="Pyramimonas parkeae, CCMP726" /LENGTH=403 /DNA_ID=CAMNT_0001373949 /DNA_START=52 /DNA_END=1264 /DNA_ORIENTATION=+